MSYDYVGDFEDPELEDKFELSWESILLWNLLMKWKNLRRLSSLDDQVLFLHEALLDNECTQLPMPLNMRPIELLEVDVREFSPEQEQE